MNPIHSFTTLLKKIFTGKVFAYGVFWSWNLLYLVLFVSLEISTKGMVFGLIKECVYGRIPVSFFLPAMIAYVIPLAALILGATRLRTDRIKLLKLFYAVEIPLTILCLLRISMVREFNPGTLHLFILVSTGMLGLFWELIRKRENTSKTYTIIYYLISCAQLCTGIYIAAVLSFYAPPIAWALIKGFFGFEWLQIFTEGFFPFIIVFFVFYSLTLFAVLPVAMILSYGSSYLQQLKNIKQRIDRVQVIGISAAFFSANFILFIMLNWWQPQVDAIGIVKNLKDNSTSIGVFNSEESNIKKGLVNAYLSDYRYLGTTRSNDHVKEIYRDIFGGQKDYYQLIQEMNNAVLKPFLYDGNFHGDKQFASEAYEQLFDTPIQKGEKEKVVSALNATWERDQAEAGILDVNEEKIHVNLQEITVKESQGYADVEIHEVYENMTYERLEGLYYFSLPENAVITGLWLSDDTTIKKYTYRVSPRGAAQQVYREQVQQSFDPSLLEQTGPGLYRLRAFPILPRTRSWSRNYREPDYYLAPPFHLWLSYRVMADSNQHYPLPVALERRNFYCDAETDFRINNEKAEKENEEDWLIPSLVATTAAPSNVLFSFSETQGIKAEKTAANPSVKIASENFAVLVDATYSMKNNLDELEKEIKAFREYAGRAEFYAYNNTLVPLNLNKLENQCYGNTELLKILEAFDTANKNKKYSALFFFTDEAGYESDDDSLKSLFPDYPIYVIHVNGAKSHAYSDAFLETIAQSHGKICTSSFEAVQALAFRKEQLKNPQLMSQHGGYTWSFTNDTNGTSSPLSALAGYEYILHQAESMPKDSLLGHMDLLHNIAMKYEIVSPFSSMIVLVNEEQQRRLDELEKQKDRFKRETETGKEMISSPGDALHIGNVTGTPEPEEWMLMGLAGCLLVYVVYQKKLARLTLDV